MRLKNISIVTQFYPPDYAATGQFIHELAAALADKGYNVSVFTGMPGYAFRETQVPKEEVDRGVLVRRTGSVKVLPRRIRGKLLSSLVFLLRSAVKFRSKLIRGSHLVITSAPPFLGVIGWLYNKCFGDTYSCIIYDIYPEVAVRLNVVDANHWLVRLWEVINAKVWQRATSLIVLSEPMKDLLLQKYPQLDPRKIHVIHSWADPKFIRPIAKEQNWFVKEHGWQDRFVVMYSGNLGRCHDEQTIVQCAELLQDNPKIQFVFIGAGAGTHAVDRAIANGATNIIKLPYQDKDVLPYSLTACDLSLLSLKPSAEGVVAPSKLYGMMAAGKPIAAICPENSYLRDLIDRGHCGQCFTNGDAEGLAAFIRLLANDAELQREMGRNARERFEQNFTLEKILPQYVRAIGLDPVRSPVGATKVVQRVAEGGI